MTAKPKRAAGDEVVLPPEIVTEILLRLPVKLILRCRSVCKSWYSLISSPNFISYHLVKNPDKNGLLIQFYNNHYDNGGFSSIAWPFISEYNGRSFVETLFDLDDDIPSRFHGSRVGIVGSCNGLICLFRFENDRNENFITFLTWNPSIRKAVELPSRSFGSDARRFFSYFGFGFDSRTGDYKVMCMHSAYSDGEGCDSSDADSNVCEIYDLSKGVWRSISPLVHPWRVNGSQPECYLHGAVHWTGCIHRNDEGCRGVLLSFGFRDETFREIVMPDHVGGCRVETQSVTIGGLVHVIVWKTKQGSYRVDDASEGGCSIWAMEEYGVTESWCKLFNIDVQSAQLYGDVFPEKFRFCENGEVLMVHDVLRDELESLNHPNSANNTNIQGLILYNTVSRECKRILPLTDCISDLCLYESSLVLL